MGAMAHRNRRAFLRSGLALSAALAAGSLAPRWAAGQEADAPAPDPPAEQPPPSEPPPASAGEEEPSAGDLPVAADQPSLLDGVWLPPEEAALVSARLPLAVVVDNLPEGARPQIGLNRADLVFETLVEGGITRFLALYQRRPAARIEPIRSVRIPHVYLASELDAPIVHVGAAETPGPSDARSQMQAWGLRNVEETSDPALFWRDRARSAPHNVATSTADLWAAAAASGWQGPPVADRWQFKDDFVEANRLAGTVGRASFAFGGLFPPQYAFAVDWTYDPDWNGYWRTMAGRPHRDGLTGDVLIAKNVVVAFYAAQIINQEGHVTYDLIGEGPASVFLDGQLIEAVWTKRRREDRTRLWDTAGVELQFNRGATWFALLPEGSPLAWE